MLAITKEKAMAAAPQGTTRITLDLPADLYRDLKIAVAVEGHSMTAVGRELFRTWIDDRDLRDRVAQGISTRT